MKLPSYFAAFALTLIATAALHAEPPKIEHVVELLRKAKDSESPLPILQHAKKEFESFRAVDGTKLAAEGAGRRKVAGVEVAGHEHKHQAMEAIDHAIAAAKSGGDVKSKIEGAIAEVHLAGTLKH